MMQIGIDRHMPDAQKSSERASRHLLLVGFTGISLLAMLQYLSVSAWYSKVVAVCFGIHIFATLVWTWWREGRHPADWSRCEVISAALAVGLFSVASSI
jgi:drug/metabolite transporter superfamily protein YnfA